MPPAPPRQRERRDGMADSPALGQNVPNLNPEPSGLYLMDGIAGLRSLPEHSVDMLLTDPPYGTTRNYWDVPLPLPELWEAVRWAVKPSGAVLFFAQCPYDKILGASNLSMLRYEWVWYKSRCTGFLNARRAPLKKTENILVFYQRLPLYNPQFEQGKPYKKIASHRDQSPNYGKFVRSGSGSEDGRRFPGNLLSFQTVAHTVHPTQKPVELCEYLIKTYTAPGEVVADICAGSFINRRSHSTSRYHVNIPAQADDFDSIRGEFVGMLKRQIARSNNGIERSKYITFGVPAEGIAAARPRLDRVEADVMGNLHRLGVPSSPLDGRERLALLHGQMHPGRREPFRFSWGDISKTGTAIFIPFMTRELRMGGQALYYGMNALSHNVIMADRKKLKSANGMYLGSTGSGKSFAAKRELINVFLATSDRIVIVDPMGEYSPLVRRLGGQVIEIAPDSPHHINPMDIQMELADKKKALYAEYRQAQRDMREAVAVKANIDHLLGLTDGRTDKEQTR